MKILQKRNLSIKDITPAFPQQTSMAMIATMQMKGRNKWKQKFLKDVYMRWDLITNHLGFGRFLYHWNQCQK